MGLNLESASDAALLSARRREEDAYAIFYRRHVASVLSYVRSRGLDPHAAADVVSLTFFAALKARKTYRPQNDTALPWLISIASRQIIDAHRITDRQDRVARRVADLFPRDLTQTDVAAYTGSHEAPDDRVVSAVQKLPADQREAVTRRIVDELDYPSLANELGVSQAAARQRVSRGLQTLRTRFANNDREQNDA